MAIKDTNIAMRKFGTTTTDFQKYNFYTTEINHNRATRKIIEHHHPKSQCRQLNSDQLTKGYFNRGRRKKRTHHRNNYNINNMERRRQMQHIYEDSTWYQHTRPNEFKTWPQEPPCLHRQGQ